MASLIRLSSMKMFLSGGLALLVLSISGSAHHESRCSLTKDQLSNIRGKIQFVDSFPDYKVKVVTSFPDLKVKKVSSFADSPGEWQIVDSFPDYKIQIVTSFPDFTIQYVDSFPGVP